MGVDSGLPDFRGNQGFWNAYPPFRKLGLSFVALANPRWFRDDPSLAWGFYGHRYNLYRATPPHDGFARLARWGAETEHGAFVFTSNVDGQFQRAGFAADRIVECHGTLDVWQCTRRCAAGPFPAPGRDVAVDLATFRAAAPLPACPACGALARPNVLMFGDDAWDGQRSVDQQRRLARWLAALDAAGAPLAIVECGAGTAVPTVRAFGEALAAETAADVDPHQRSRARRATRRHQRRRTRARRAGRDRRLPRARLTATAAGVKRSSHQVVVNQPAWTRLSK